MSAGLSGLSATTEEEARAVIARVDALSTHHDIEQAGVRIRWRRFGPADGGAHPPLVLLHGGHGSWMHWLRNAEALSAERAVAARHAGLQRFGHAAPPAPTNIPLAPSLAALAGSLDALIGAGTRSTSAVSPSAAWWPRSSRCTGARCAACCWWAAAATARCGAWRSR